MSEPTKQDLLRRAMTLMGRELLAESLKCSPSLLDAWVSGKASMPDRTLVMLADILHKYATRK
jgi:hypothetical protein